jgi:hypothetical protein
MLGNYSSMSITLRGTSGGDSYTFNSNYTVVYSSPTTYKLELSLVTGQDILHYTSWVNKDATVVAVMTDGVNYTGSQADEYFQGAMAGFIVEMVYSSPQLLSVFTSSPFIHTVNQTSVTLGPTTLKVTNFVADNLPQTISSCGSTITLDQFAVQAGSPASSEDQVVTYLQLVGSLDYGGGPQSVNFVLSIDSMTVA